MKFSESHPVSPSSSFRLRLQPQLAACSPSNPQYSLRAFPVHLGVDHSTLSQLLRARRKLTEAAAQKATDLGAALIMPKQVLPDGDEMAIIHDGFGITFGLLRKGKSSDPASS